MEISSNELHRKFLNARKLTSTYRSLITEEDVNSILTQDCVRGLLANELQVEPFLIGHYTNLVSERGLKILSILICIGQVSALLDHFLYRDIWDKKLPLTASELHPDFSNAFLSEQQQFLSPVFTYGLFMDWESDVLLPFATDEAIPNAEGSFATVAKVEILPGFQQLMKAPDGISRKACFARKELKTRRSDASSAAFHREKKALDLLNLVQHPHIIPLLASYVHGDSFNMIFPLADTDLEAFLTGTANTITICQEALWLQVLGITSALDTLHRFQHQVKGGLNLEKIGYHHDLKPQNILIRNCVFLLADFGLARLKDDHCDSATVHKYGAVTYGAPETQQNLGKHIRVGRALDVWSWGCILSEIMTFDLLKSAGILRFREFRRTDTGKTVDSCFHDMVEVKSEVRIWIDILRDRALVNNDGYGNMIVEMLLIVEKMLAADPSSRPSSDVVFERLHECHQRYVNHLGRVHEGESAASAARLDLVDLTERPLDAKVVAGNTLENLDAFLDSNHAVMRALRLSTKDYGTP